MPIGHTDRGFADYADFRDSYGAHVRVRESSAAAEPKVWIFVDKIDIGNKGAIHLTVDQAKVLVAALKEWLDANTTATT
jgi:hypothetical protein